MGRELSCLLSALTMLGACSAEQADRAPARSMGAGVPRTASGSAGSTSFQPSFAGSPPAASGRSAIQPTGSPQPAADGGSRDVCARDRYRAEQRPLTIYTLFDESGSMLFFWPAVTDAFTAFVRDPRSAGINIGLKYFGAECQPEFYSVPDVAIQSLPQNADAIATSLASRIPLAQTPMAQAIEGATLALAKYAASHPEEKTVILLVTDASSGIGEGDPEDCYSTVAQAAAVAADARAATPSIETYVLGLGDAAGLNMLSQAGGTGTAIIADPSASALVVDAIREVRRRALPCDYTLPAGAERDLALVNLERIQADGSTTTVPGVGNRAACDPVRGGWYYDDPKAPKQIVSCPATCESFTDAAEVNVVLGCPTIGPQ